ncbi:serine/threonine-protein kinase [Glycomyces halotolerans]
MHIGTLIAGRYRLDDRLAAGGMGEVWRGTDTRLSRVVAVKLLHSGLAGNDRFRARFQQEARAVAALQSPGIVALYDYGEEPGPDGVISYLIMELVRGTSLDKVIAQRGRLSPPEVLKIVATAAEALDVAHRAGIVHRDIKPGNLLVDEEGAVKIVDFGIASARGQAGLTETGTVMGTLHYASPEQLSGGDLTGATDQYSLGIVAYECLAGRAPFGGGDPAAVITQHMTGQPAPLPQDVPPPVAQIVMRCLVKDPRQRFASAGELAQAARDGRMAPGQGTTAILPPTSPPNRSTRAMAQGMVPAGQHTQAMGMQDPGSPPPGRELPPPRDFEEPERSKVVPVILTVAGVLILLIALTVWWRSAGEETPTAGDGPESGAPAQSEAAETTEAADDEAEQQTEDDQEEDDASDDDQHEEEPTTEAPSEPTGESGMLTMEDYVGDDVADAKAELEGEGFNNVVEEVAESADEDADECEVVEQQPSEGSDVGYDTPITLYYVPGLLCTT